MEELQVIDLQFLYNCSKPTICILYQDSKGARHVKTYEILLDQKEFASKGWAQANVEASASLLIPIPTGLYSTGFATDINFQLGGVIVIGEQTISYLDGHNAPRSIPMRIAVIKAYETRLFEPSSLLT